MFARSPDEIARDLADAVREIGGRDTIAKVAVQRAARATGLSVSTIERVRWRKVRRVPADVYVAITAALEAHRQAQERRDEHDRAVLAALRADAPRARCDGDGAGQHPPGTNRAG